LKRSKTFKPFKSFEPAQRLKIPKQPTNVRRGELPGWLAKIDILKIFSVFKTGVSLASRRQMTVLQAPAQSWHRGTCKDEQIEDGFPLNACGMTEREEN